MDASRRKGCSPGDICEGNKTGDSSTTAAPETKWVRSNLSPPELQALKTLRRKQDIVIKPADKGSAVVVLKKSDYMYIKEAERQLGNKDHYQKIEKDPTPFIPLKSKKLLQRCTLMEP